MDSGSPSRELIRTVAAFAIPFAIVILGTAVLALIRPAYQRRILAAHAVVFSLAAVALLIWVIRTLFTGFAPGTSVSCSPGILTLVCTYPVYLARRVFPADSARGAFRKYAHVLVAAVIVPIDLAFGVRVLLYMQRFLEQHR